MCLWLLHPATTKLGAALTTWPTKPKIFIVFGYQSIKKYEEAGHGSACLLLNKHFD